MDKREIRASTRRIGRGDYVAVLRDGRDRVVWECQHMHTERDVGLRSAYVCAANARDMGLGKTEQERKSE